MENELNITFIDRKPAKLRTNKKDVEDWNVRKSMQRWRDARSNDPVRRERALDFLHRFQGFINYARDFDSSDIQPGSTS